MKHTTVRELILLTTIVALVIPYFLPYFERSPPRMSCNISPREIESWVRSADAEIKPITMRVAAVPPHGQREGAQIDFAFASSNASLEQFANEISSQLRRKFAKDGLSITDEWGNSDFCTLILSGGSSQHFVTVHAVELSRDGGEARPNYQVSCLALTEN